MEKKTIRVSRIIGGPICVTVDDGQKVFDILHQAITDNVRLEVSFEGIDLIISAFLNIAIGQLYGDFTAEQIDSMLSYTHLAEDDKGLLRLVIDNALRYYSNPKGYDNAVREVLEYA
jgi:hypothetical protein